MREISREILFRGKLIASGEWAYGNLVIKTNGVSIITPDDTPLGKYGQVLPKTVGQYTGLTDKNGKKIFEGDILNAKNEFHDYYERFIVVWDDEAAGFYFNGCRNTDCNYFFDNLSDIKIIGNIHDNPELLEV